MRARRVYEEQKQGSLFRSTDQDWLRIFLDQDQIMSPSGPGKYISLSRDSESGGMDTFGGKEAVIEFDEDMIFDQDAIEIFYEPEFFEKYPDICMYVTAYKGEQDYYEQNDLSGRDEAMESTELTWEDYLEGYEHEEEIVMKRLSYQPGLIKHVDIFTPAHPILIEMLEENNIRYTAHKGKASRKAEKYSW
jgi:hypothetical protein